MRHRVRAIIVILSITACAITVGFMLLAHLIDPREDSKRVGKDLNVSLIAPGWDARLWLFNDNGPWSGPTADASKVLQFAYPGVEHQRIVWPNGEVNFSLDISLMIPFLLLGVFPLLLTRRARKRDQAFSILPPNGPMPAAPSAARPPATRSAAP